MKNFISPKEMSTKINLFLYSFFALFP